MDQINGYYRRLRGKEESELEDYTMRFKKEILNMDEFVQENEIVTEKRIARFDSLELDVDLEESSQGTDEEDTIFEMLENEKEKEENGVEKFKGLLGTYTTLGAEGSQKTNPSSVTKS